MNESMSKLGSDVYKRQDVASNKRPKALLKKVDSILVHRKCREKYTLKRNNVLCYKDLGTLLKKSKYSPVK